MSHLISNAIKFSESGSSIEITVEQIAPWVQISVQDHGNGIPEEFQPKVFDKFTQADSSDTRKQGGTGLGMYISKILVENHNGEIEFETKPGFGTRFFFRLPMIDSKTMDLE